MDIFFSCATIAFSERYHLLGSSFSTASLRPSFYCVCHRYKMWRHEEARHETRHIKSKQNFIYGQIDRPIIWRNPENAMLPLYRDKSLYSSLLQVWPAVYTHASMYSGIYLAPSGPAASLLHIPHVLSIPRSAASTTFQSYKLVTHSRDKKTLSARFTTSFTHRRERGYFMDAFLC